MLCLQRRHRDRRGDRHRRSCQQPEVLGFTDYDNYIATDSWTTISINTTDYNDQNAFDAGSNRFTAPVAGLYTFGATCLYKVNSSTSARMQARLLQNGADVVPGSFGSIAGAHFSEGDRTLAQRRGRPRRQ